ncbi:MAG: amidase [Actinomycetia bacterium]|nr:amidase [Actinomycetes bacterium]MCP4962651.1 amidase [Actinomycetes bacterium]
MKDSSLSDIDAVGHAELVSSGQATPRELAEAAVERIEAVNPQLNAVVLEWFDAAIAGADDAPDGPLRGVPFLLKDIGATQKGTPTYLGNRAMKAADNRAPADSVLGARFRAAGLVTLGKTNLPELGTVPVTQPKAFGPTNNPWDLGRSPSGSSGGSAAAVASGMVPVAHANDGGGSTRLPASWNGLVGLKTTRGRQPLPEGVSRLTSELVVSRTVRDTAAVLDATHGHTPACVFQLPPPGRPFGDELGQDIGRPRVAVLTDAGAEYDADPECVEAAWVAARQLESWGCEVVEVDASVIFGPLSRVNGRAWMAGITRRVDALGEVLGWPLAKEHVDPYNWVAADRGRSISAADAAAAAETQQVWVRQMFEWMHPFDLLVTPTSGCPPLLTSEAEPDADKPWRVGRLYGLVGRFTMPFNVTGHPAISLPLHWTTDGLPVGSQIVGRMGDEAALLRVASRFEAEMPWNHRRPPVSA